MFILPIAFTALNLISVWTVGRKHRHGWLISLTVNICWGTYFATTTQQPTLTVGPIIFGFLSLWNWKLWKDDPMSEAVYTLNRLRALLDDPLLYIPPVTRQRLIEQIEAAEHAGQSTVILAKPVTALALPTQQAIDYTQPRRDQ